MRLTSIPVTEDLRELTVRGRPGFRMEIYDNSFADFITGSVPWHWHVEVEIVLVTRGTLNVATRFASYVVEKGSGIFLNSNVLHAMTQAGEENCEMLGLVFDPSLIIGEPHSVFSVKYVLPLTQNTGISAVALSPVNTWQNAMIKNQLEIAEICDCREFGYELAVRARLSEIWRLLVLNHREEINSALNTQSDGRIKTMLSFIADNYMNNLTLSDIAASAGVCSRECSRVFRSNLGVTPFGYLTDFRIRAAAELLASSAHSITDICYLVGFQNPCYFSKVFREAVGMAPREYRKKNS